MIYTPANASPRSSAIDASLDNTFEFLFQGDALYRYYIVVYNNDTSERVYTSKTVSNADGTPLAYNGEIVTATVPANSFINDRNYIWQVVMFEDLPSMMVASGVVQKSDNNTTTTFKIRNHPQLEVGMFITINFVDYEISGYNYDSGEVTVKTALPAVPAENTAYKIMTNFIASPSFFFRALKTPKVTLTAPSSLTSRVQKFVGTYTQEQHVPVRYHQFSLYAVGTERLIITTGRVYSSRLEWEYDGFTPDTTYRLELLVESQAGQECSDVKEFATAYPYPDLTAPPIVELNEDDNSARITWRDDMQSVGITTGECELVQDFPFKGTNSAWLKSGELYYDQIARRPLYVEEDSFTVFLSTCLADKFDGDIIALDSDDQEKAFCLRLHDYKFMYRMKDQEKQVGAIYDVFEDMIGPTKAIDDVCYVWNNDIPFDFKTADGGEMYWRENTTDLSGMQWKFVLMPTDCKVKRIIYSKLTP